MTQCERILNYLQLQPLCSLAPLHWEPMIVRVAARIGDLKAAGHEITAVPCRMHVSGPPHVVYELVDANQLRLAI